MVLFLIFWAVICWIGGASAGMGALAATILVLVKEVCETDDEGAARFGCTIIIVLFFAGLILV